MNNFTKLRTYEVWTTNNLKKTYELLNGLYNLQMLTNDYNSSSSQVPKLIFLNINYDVNNFPFSPKKLAKITLILQFQRNKP